WEAVGAAHAGGRRRLGGSGGAVPRPRPRRLRPRTRPGRKRLAGAHARGGLRALVGRGGGGRTRAGPRRHRGGGLRAVTELAFGGAPLGNLYAPIAEATADATVDPAWGHGVRTIDTAPLIGGC